MKKILLSFATCGIIVASAFNTVVGQTAASAVWQPESSTNIPGTVAVTGAISADPQGGTMEAFTYSGSVTAVNNATGYQRTRSTTDAPQLPYGNVYNPNAYLQYKVSPANGQYLRVDEAKVTILGGGTGNARLVVKYSTDGNTFLDMPVPGAYFLADGTATPYNATEAQPVVLLNTGATAMEEAKRTLSFSGIKKTLAPGQSFYIRLYPYLTDMTLPSTRYLMSRQMVISGVTAASAEVLPLDFLSFNAKLTSLGNQVKIDWSTANEVNTSSFIIERSTNGTFSRIGTVASKNASGKQSYSFVDNNPATGTSYYRLTQIDKDGKSKTFDKIITIQNNGGIALSVSPNPANTPSVSVSHPAASVNASIKVVNLQGQVVASASPVAGDTKTSMSVSDLASGLYIVSFENGGSKLTYKFVKK